MKRLFCLLFVLMGSQWIMPKTNADEDWMQKDPLWKAVQQALDEGRPQTALEKLRPIAERAKSSGDRAEQIRVELVQIDLKAATTESPPDARLKELRVAIDAADVAKRPVMEAALATWMWDFFQQHRWQFSGRTAIELHSTADGSDATEAGAPPQNDNATELSQWDIKPDSDLMTWDLRRILVAIDRQFQKSLRLAEELKTVSVKEYEKLLVKGTVPEIYRPTMYDLLVHHALEFYQAGEQAGSRANNAFDLLAESPIFASTNDFLAWQPSSSDERAPLLVAVRLFQDLLRFHSDDDDPTARLDADLHRLEFGNNHAIGPEKSARYRASLERFVADHSSHPVSASAQANLAQLIMEANDPAAAHSLASAVIKNHPESIGSRKCFNLIQQIEARDVQVSTERVWNAPWPTIDVTYRNVAKVYFRLVPFDFVEFVKSQRWQPEALDQNQHRKLVASKPVRAWSADLPATTDYKQRTEQLSVPTDLPMGSYFLLSSHQEDFSEPDNQLGLAEVWVSKLALVTRSLPNDGVVAGLVLDAQNGTPIANAKVRAWQHDRNSQSRLEISAVSTNQDGEFQFPAGNRGNVLLLIETELDQLSSASMVSSSRQDRVVPGRTITQFFLDRAIYRPGQTVRYKGICASFDQNNDQYAVLPGQSLVVALYDANGQEVERLDHRTNDYGSFSGSFTAPRGRLTGAMTVRVLQGPIGQSSFRVEEYKRPKFEVTLQAPKEAPQLNSRVEIVGHATAYTGANVGSASVQWRVVREVRFPPWWYWRMWWLPPSRGESQEISRGTAQTDQDGKFVIQFDAKPDLSVAEDSEPTFQYSVTADVTDGTGETRSDQFTVNVGYTALAASLTADQWQTTEKKVVITARTTSLDGVGQAAEGTVKIHSLLQPDKVQRAALGSNNYAPIMPMSGNRTAGDQSNPAGWQLGPVVAEFDLETDAVGNQKLEAELVAGIYRAVLVTADRFGHRVTAELPIEVFDLASTSWEVRLPNRLAIENSTLEPGKSLRAVWATGYAKGQVLVEIEHRGKLIQRYWTPPNVTQALIEIPITEQMRGGITVHTTFVRENRAYLETRSISVPWSNKVLDVTWERFVSKLQPAQKETWTAVIKGSDAERAAAEMVATLYDASLDVFAPNYWASGFSVFRHEYTQFSRNFGNLNKSLQVFANDWRVNFREVDWRYPMLDFPRDFGQSIRGRNMLRGFGGGRQRMFSDGLPMPEAAAPMAMESAGEAPGASEDSAMQQKSAAGATRDESNSDGSDGGPKVSLEGIPVRKNLNETAFFFPHVLSDENGVVKLEFTMPEALTRWRFLGFAHDRELRGGLLSDSAVTSKDLMIQPNPPRFLREGDEIEFTVKVTNLSPGHIEGKAGLDFLDPRSGGSLNSQLENEVVQKDFAIAAGGSQSLSWRIKVSDDLTLLSYRAVATTGRLSDGEEGYLPVLSRRILVTESLPLPIRGKQTKQFQFQRLLESGTSTTLRHQSLTVQMASNPAWYAVLSLPYLMEYPHQCSEQLFNRLYANSLAQRIAVSDPKIERVFEQWKGTEALDSPLEKNQELKSVVLEESPWIRQAQSESQSRRNIAILFDRNRLSDELSRATEELAQRQFPDGRWSWFPDGPASDFITLYITTGFGRLSHLGVNIDLSMAIRSLGALDQWMTDNYQRVIESGKNSKDKPEATDVNHLDYSTALYLYGRSFFLPENPVAAQHQPALAFWLDQAKKHWLKMESLQSQAHLAIALSRFGDRATAKQIVVSLKERSLSNEEMGTYWKAAAQSYWWYHAPIETQATLIEAMDEVAGDQEMVEDCRVWLIKQKQTQNWKSTKATADAVYALLLRGTDLLASDRIVEVELDSALIEPDKIEAGTGFYERRFPSGDISPNLGNVTVTKHDNGVAWGSMHWQYFEDIDRVTSFTDTPLNLSKELFVKRNGETGPQLLPIEKTGNGASIRVGDELVVRLVLKVDRDLEYVHLKDHRGSGTEPVNVLSGYRYQDGLGYYEATRDTASHFFIDYLRKGTYVFEYSTRVHLRGSYQTGMAEIQCMYAPEFNSHSQSIRIVVDEFSSEK